MVTVAYCSDLHLDNFRFFNGHAYPPIVNTKDNPADILILAGDLYEYKYMNDHKTFIQTLADSYKYVLIVEGNHEFYESDIDDKPSFTYPENVILLKNETFIYEDIVFYGGTLWSNLSQLSSLDQYNIKHMISDFKLISNKAEGTTFSIEKMGDLYNEFIENLYEAQLNLQEDQKLFVISHFAPSILSVTPRFAGSALNPYFCNELDELIVGLKPIVWVHGHTHSTHDYMIGNTRILCNPRGYPREMNHDVYLPKRVTL